jgi:hypothetical protein
VEIEVSPSSSIVPRGWATYVARSPRVLTALKNAGFCVTDNSITDSELICPCAR